MRTMTRIKVLENDMFPEQIDELHELEVVVKNLRGFPSIEQTKRNRISRDLVQGLFNWVKDELETKRNVANVYYTLDGVAIEVSNDNVYEQFSEGNGCITILLKVEMPNLGYDALENLRTEADGALRNN